MKKDELIISAIELEGRIDDGDETLRLFDCRWSLTDPSLGQKQFDERHIPTAQYMPLEPALSDPAGKRGRHPLPEKSRFAATLGAFGVANTSDVVVYDDGSSTYACRLWWMLRWVGHSKVRLLDGGLTQWDDWYFDTSQVVEQVESTHFEVRPSLTRVYEADDLLTTEYPIIDARTQDRFKGRNETLDHTAGHIPNARCFPFDANTRGDKCFTRSQVRFREFIDQDAIVCYCGSGVTATNNIMALMLAGFPEPILYPGSWSEWIEDPTRPIEL